MRNKKNMSSRSYILQIMLWHKSLKSIHYRTLFIPEQKKPTDLRVKTLGDKRHVIPPCQNIGGIHHPHNTNHNTYTYV